MLLNVFDLCQHFLVPLRFLILQEHLDLFLPLIGLDEFALQLLNEFLLVSVNLQELLLLVDEYGMSLRSVLSLSSQLLLQATQALLLFLYFALESIDLLIFA